jgi:hypothetical protein
LVVLDLDGILYWEKMAGRLWKGRSPFFIDASLIGGLGLPSPIWQFSHHRAKEIVKFIVIFLHNFIFPKIGRDEPFTDFGVGQQSQTGQCQ